MRIKNFFVIAVAVPTLACLVGGASIVTDLWQIYSGNGQARAESAAMAALAKAIELYAVQRGTVNFAMLGDSPVNEDIRKTLEDQISASEAAIHEAVVLTQGLDMEGGVDMAAAVADMSRRMTVLDASVASAVRRPKAERDPELLKTFAGTIPAIIGAASPVMDHMEKDVAAASGSVGDMIAIARLGMDFRSFSGNRSVKLLECLLSGRPATAEAMNAIGELKGGMDQTWRRIVFMVDQAGRPPALVEALQRVDTQFRTASDRLYAPVLTAAGTDGQYNIDVLTYRRQAAEALTHIAAIRNAAFIEAQQRAEDAQRQAGMRLIATIAIVTASLVISLALGFTFGRRVVNSLIILTGTIGQLADGNHDITVPERNRKDELGQLAEAIEILRGNARSAAALSAQSEADNRVRAERAHQLDRLCSDFGSESAELIHAMGAAAQDAITQSRITEEMTHDVLLSADRAAQSSRTASTSVQTVAAATEELSSSINEITSRVGLAADVSTKAMHETAEATRRIGGLAEAASRIGDVVGLITDVAGQTNLLALNATIEAARAGEAGKGFAVVANEVKALAGQTAKATTEISGQVGSIQVMTKDAVACIESVTATIGSLNEIATAIAAAVEEQGAATSEIARNIQLAAAGTQDAAVAVDGVSDVVSKTEAASQALVDAMKGLEERANRLTDSIGGFVTQVRA